MRTGWNFTIETTNGKVSLWTAWHGKEFKLFYPLSVDISDEMIMEILNVTLAEPKEENEVSESRLRTENCLIVMRILEQSETSSAKNGEWDILLSMLLRLVLIVRNFNTRKSFWSSW